MKTVLFFLLFCTLHSQQILQPQTLEPYMFTIQIPGNVDPLKPSKLTKRNPGEFPIETYEINMVKTNHQFLPDNFNATPIYAYSGHTEKGDITSFPGPAIVVMKDTPVEIIWTNKINESHFLPVEIHPPFELLAEYLDEVPTVPHLHGLENEEYSDGQPFAYWTFSGRRGRQYNSLKSYKEKNQAIYRYFNTVPGLYWYHDHMIGMTRLNVYAGLAGGVYEVIDPTISSEERKLIGLYGNIDRKFYCIVDKTFKTDGQLFYPDKSGNYKFTSWVPEFFGNVMTVNGKLWPKDTVENRKFRLVFLNACQSRYLNLFFIDTATNEKIPFELIRVDSDYLRKPVVLKEYFYMIASRIQIVIDFGKVKGDAILKNDAAAPYPHGDPEFFNEKYTGTIMKFQIAKGVTLIDILPELVSQKQKTTILDSVIKKFYEMNPNIEKYDIYYNPVDFSYYPLNPVYNTWPFNLNDKQGVDVNFQQIIKVNQKYPLYPEGIPHFIVLLNTYNARGEVSSIMIDGVSMALGDRCQGSTFKIGEVYDVYIINLTEDQHPIHIHLVSFQTIARFDFRVKDYQRDYLKLNGPLGERGFSKHPTPLDVRPYLTNREDAKEHEKLLTDMMGAPTQKVTLARVKFLSRGDSNFLFPVKGSSFVWHCHILEHEDNEMMRWFCLE